jgi:hypothetical protein
MDDTALQQRLDAIERRQRLTLAGLGGLSLAALLWVLVTEVAAVTVWTAGAAAVGVSLLALVAGIARRRRARA